MVKATNHILLQTLTSFLNDPSMNKMNPELKITYLVELYDIFENNLDVLNVGGVLVKIKNNIASPITNCILSDIQSQYIHKYWTMVKTNKEVKDVES